MIKQKGNIIFFLILVLIMFTSCDKLSEEDELAREDDKGSDNGEQIEEADLFPDTPLGQKLDNHMQVLTMPAETLEEADNLYAESLNELRKNPVEVVQLLKQAYTIIEENRFFERWGLVKTLTDLNINESYPVLTSIIQSEIPEEKLENLHHFSTQEEEQIIRLQGVEGLTKLATSQKNKEAEEELLRIVLNNDYSHFAIKKRAIKGYLKAGRDKDARIKFLKEKLPEEIHGIITLEVTPIEVFQERVKDLITISDEQTNDEGSEEKLPEEDAPAIKGEGEIK